MTIVLGSKKEKAINFRKRGYSLKEISKVFGISKSTASLWLRHVVISKQGKARIKILIKRGINKSVAFNQKSKNQKEIQFQKEARSTLKKIKQKNKSYYKLIVAIMYWCEGAKADRNSRVAFINSDPKMIKVFITLLRNYFIIDESKWRCCLHLHSYHNKLKQIKFWSDITGIPKKNFNKVFLKQNTSKRIKKDYPGCLSLRYNSSKIAKELYYLYREFYRGVG